MYYYMRMFICILLLLKLHIYIIDIKKVFLYIDDIYILYNIYYFKILNIKCMSFGFWVLGNNKDYYKYI